MSPVLITLIAVFIGTAALCAGVGLTVLSKSDDPLARLDKLNRKFMPAKESSGILKKELLEEGVAGLHELWERIGVGPNDVRAWVRQAELPVRVWVLFAIGGLAGLGLIVVAKRLHAPLTVYPFLELAGLISPLFYILWRRKKLISRFSEQLPDALELMASSLRSGNTIQSALQIISEEFMPPISREFAVVSESIRLGIPVEQALDELISRVDNPDLDFFVTAVSMQRTCGGDLSEILDKISWLIRERFHIQGQVQALTGEGRMSGAVLMALPVVLFFVVYTLNPEYVMLLFTEPMGRKMLAGAIVMQLLGAIVIRKIINIKI